MGLFDKFRKKVQEAAEEANLNELSAEENSEEAEAALAMRESSEQPPLQQEGQIAEDDDWEEFDENEELELPSEEDDWDDWDDEEVPATLPVKLSRREKKILAREEKKKANKEKAKAKEMKRRGAKEVGRLAGSKVDLHMMRTTTGRQLVEVKSSPAGSTGIKEEDGIKIDLGGGVVESGGRIIKDSEALRELLEELEWIMLESDISSDAVSAVMDLFP